MEQIYTLIAAIAPATLLTYWIVRQDSYRAEPIRWLLKGVGYGVLSGILVIVLSIFWGIEAEDPTSVFDAFEMAFFQAAIPEECMKLLMLWLLLRKNIYFDEHLDGIVYCVCIGMGFAGFENILYLFDNYDEWVVVGISRALMAVPGHFFFAVLMGYFYSLAYFEQDKRLRNMFLTIIVPIMAHGVYDFLVFSSMIMPELAVILMISVIYGLNKLRKHCSKLIAEHRQKDIDNLEQESNIYLNDK